MDEKKLQSRSGSDNVSQGGMTVIVPVYNRAGLVLRTLDSIWRQQYRPLNLIVVDNNSTDHTGEVVERWMATRRADDFSAELLHEPRRGAAISRQTGFEHASTEYVMFFDSDDIMLPMAVATAMERFRQHPEADMVVWPIRIHHRNGVARETHSLRGDLMIRHLVHTVFSTQRYAVRADFFRRYGGWNPKLRGWDDLELGARLMLGRPKIAPVTEVMGEIYFQPDSITGIDFSSKEGEWEMALDEIESAIAASNHASKQRYLRFVDYRRALLAAEYLHEDNLIAARDLLVELMTNRRLSKRQKMFLRWACRYTARGGRGAAIPAVFIL